METWSKLKTHEKGINSLNKHQLVFTYRNNRLYRPCYVNDWLDIIIKTYNLKKITIHGFRHSHCSLLFEMGTLFK